MTLGDTWSETEANAKGRDLGAVTSGVAYYPPARKWSLEKGTHLETGKPFAIHYFNPEGLEVGYWLIDLKSFHVLEEPRVWDPCLKPATSSIPMEE